MFDVDTDLLAQPNRGPSKVAFARHVAMYLAHVACGLSLTAVGRLFKRDRTTVSYACRRIEDMRDRPQYDRAIGMMENTVRAIVRVSPALKQDLQLAEEENA
ncbi:MAG: chromosomal replication initiator DnaA [Alphaproteobacteria bacterium]|nr:chromosomal replication initiator DnaA [Alphaproteobacteria bacterium]